MKTILGKKIGMTQVFAESGEAIPVTVIEAGPVTITQVKTKDTDGYEAIQIAFEDQKEQRLTKPLKGHFDKAGVSCKKHIAEVRLEVEEELKVGQVISVIDFDEGKLVDITGTSKGKGTQGNIKRHGHHRGPVTHGSKHKRLVGALAGAAYPGRVFKGNKGPGRMGRETITIQNIEIVKIMPERNIMLVKGAVPGAKGTILRIQYAVKDENSIKEVGPTGREMPKVEAPEVAPEVVATEEVAAPEAVETAEAAPAEEVAPEATPAAEAPAEEATPVEEVPAEEAAPAEEAKEETPAEEAKEETPAEEAKEESKEEEGK